MGIKNQHPTVKGTEILGQVTDIIIASVENRQRKIFAPAIAYITSYFEKNRAYWQYFSSLFIVLFSLGNLLVFPLIS